MAASYPATYKSFTRVTEDPSTGTVISATLFTQMKEELEAMEAELGVEPHGICGSVVERLDVELLTAQGKLRNMVQNFENVVGGGEGGSFPYHRRRITGGIYKVSDNITATPNTKDRTISFDFTFPTTGFVPDGAAVFCSPGKINGGGDCISLVVIARTASPPTGGIFTGFRVLGFASNGGPPLGSPGYAINWVAVQIVPDLTTD